MSRLEFPTIFIFLLRADIKNITMQVAKCSYLERSGRPCFKILKNIGPLARELKAPPGYLDGRRGLAPAFASPRETRPRNNRPDELLLSLTRSTPGQRSSARSIMRQEPLRSITTRLPIRSVSMRSGRQQNGGLLSGCLQPTCRASTRRT